MTERQIGLRTALMHDKKSESEINSSHSHRLPIHETTLFCFKSVEEMHAAIERKTPSHIYGRYSNPNCEELERKITLLENGELTRVFPSGMAAIATMAFALLQKGDHVVANYPLYSETFKLFTKILPRFGINSSFCNGANIADFAFLITPHTRLILIESPTNPTLNIVDIKKLSAYLKKRISRNIIFAADNTLGSPYNQRPLELGADIVIESETKYIDGSGRHNGGSTSGSEDLIKKIGEYRNTLGSIMAPKVASDISESISPTFLDRMRRHNENGLRTAKFLKNHPKVERVYYPGLESHPKHEIAKKQMRTRDGEPAFGGMVSLELKGPLKKIFDFVNTLIRQRSPVFSLGVSLGNKDSLICMPYFTTHASLAPEEKLRQGIPEKLIRLSVGIENHEDIENALAVALEKI